MIISEEQQEFLNHAKHKAERLPGSLSHIFYDLASGDRKFDEPLVPEWRTLWEKHFEKIKERTPTKDFNEITDFINTIEGIENTINSIELAPKDSICFLLGAGASKPDPSSIPTVNELLPEMWLRAGKLGRDDIDKLALWCDQHDIDNIEDLLTAAYLANYAAKKSSVTDLLDYFLFNSDNDQIESNESRFLRNPYRRRSSRFASVDTASIALLQDTLQTIFGLLTGTMIPAQPNAAHKAIAEYPKKHPNTSIITTNYDGCIDEALHNHSFNVNTHLEHGNLKNGNSPVNLIKIHGSINWTYCDSCHEVKEFDIPTLKKNFEDDNSTYAVIGICKNCGGQRRPLLIPPLGFKFIMFPSLIHLWDQAREKIEKSNYIIIVGYSFSEADSHVNKIIESSMTRNTGQKIIVCDPNNQITERLKKRLTARMDKFDSKRIIAAVGSADKIVPEVLKRITKEKENGTANSGKKRQ